MINIPLSTIQTTDTQWRKAHAIYDPDSHELHVQNTRGKVLATMLLLEALNFRQDDTGRWWTNSTITIKETPGCGCGGTQEWQLNQLNESEWI